MKATLGTLKPGVRTRPRAACLKSLFQRLSRTRTALALGRFIQGQLFGVALVDPVTFGVVPLVLGASAGLASFLPARRATKIDPANALREG